MTGGVAHHLGVTADQIAGNGARGRYFVVPGSSGRAAAIAERFEEHQVFRNGRGLDVHIGQLVRDGQRLDVGVVSTGMGCPSLGIVVNELIDLGVRRLLRVGTCGSLQPASIQVGDLVVATAAVRDEGTSDAYAPREVPATAHPHWIEALTAAASELGLGEQTWSGVIHTKDALYGREMPRGPMAEENGRYMAVLADMGVLASEMESSHLFLLAAARNKAPEPVSSAAPTQIKAGTLLAVIGDEHAFADAERAGEAVERAVGIALHAMLRLDAIEKLLDRP